MNEMLHIPLKDMAMITGAMILCAIISCFILYAAGRVAGGKQTEKEHRND